jgi:hypothetical protein
MVTDSIRNLQSKIIIDTYSNTLSIDDCTTAGKPCPGHWRQRVTLHIYCKYIEDMLMNSKNEASPNSVFFGAPPGSELLITVDDRR